ncbi:MAG: hypothetical protein Q7T58_05175 [Methylotenera sp.]|nr:hypothetical protein [Methylotenera sp.]
MIGTGLLVIYPEALWVGVSFVVIGVLLLICDVKIEHGHIEYDTQQSLWKRLRRISIKHIALFFIFILVIGLVWYFQHQQVAKTQFQESKKKIPSLEYSQRPYDLSEPRRGYFLELLKTKQFEPRDTVRIGCISWSDASCVVAGKFLILFSQAGWKIDSDRVYRMDPDIPVDGMAIASSNGIINQEKLPPHLGRWKVMSSSQIIINMAFTQMAIPVRSVEDDSLPPKTIGIYFGPEPSSGPNTSAAHKTIRKQIIGLVSEAAEVQNICARALNSQCKNMWAQWNAKVSTCLNELGPPFITEWKNQVSNKNIEYLSKPEIEKQKSLLITLFFEIK